MMQQQEWVARSKEEGLARIAVTCCGPTNWSSVDTVICEDCGFTATRDEILAALGLEGAFEQEGWHEVEAKDSTEGPPEEGTNECR